MKTLLAKYYDHCAKKIKSSKEESIAFDILADMSDRRGLRQEWNGIDDDIKIEIIQKWIDIVKKNLSE